MTENGRPDGIGMDVLSMASFDFVFALELLVVPIMVALDFRDIAILVSIRRDLGHESLAIP